jgi:hypothetical protein
MTLHKLRRRPQRRRNNKFVAPATRIRPLGYAILRALCACALTLLFA